MESLIDGRVALYAGDCRAVVAALDDHSVDSIVTDPPYALTQASRGGSPRTNNLETPYGRTKLGDKGFMGKQWDTGEVVFDAVFWVDALRVLKPGGHLLAFSGTRTYHRMACAIEDAGFEIRDQIGWAYGCLDEATKAVTPKGVVHNSELKAGDTILTYDVARNSYQWGAVEHVHRYRISDTVYRISTDYGEQVVSRNHRCIVERGGKESFEFAEEIARQREARVPILEDLPTLLASVPGTHEGASGSQYGVFKNLQGRDHWSESHGATIAVEQAHGRSVRRLWREMCATAAGLAAKGSRAGLFSRVQRGAARPGHRAVVGRVTPEHYDGVIWCVTVSTGAFVAVRNGMAFPTGNSGFPKSHDVSKAIDKAAGITREDKFEGSSRPQDAAQSDAAKKWAGWGTALKPSWEPVCVARKPLIGTVAENVLTHGTGAINIDGCRVGDFQNTTPSGIDRLNAANAAQGYRPGTYQKGTPPVSDKTGRFPANIIHDGSEEVVQCFPSEAGAFAPVKGTEPSAKATFNVYGDRDRVGTLHHGDSGSAARFFYTAKADSEDRLGSKHPTVKPIDLMQWLVRLVTPPGGVVLDPFAGTGSTGEAAWREGMRAILIEREEEYQEDIRRRMTLMLKPTERAAVAKTKNKIDGAKDTPLFSIGDRS